MPKPALVESVSSPLLQVDTDVPMPSFKRRATRSTVYPFDSLEVGHSFHVPRTEQNPDPVSKLNSSAAAARKRHAKPMVDENGNPVTYSRKTKAGVKELPRVEITRDFKVQEVGNSDPRGPGARVFRTA